MNNRVSGKLFEEYHSRQPRKLTVTARGARVQEEREAIPQFNTRRRKNNSKTPDLREKNNKPFRNETESSRTHGGQGAARHPWRRRRRRQNPPASHCLIRPEPSSNPRNLVGGGLDLGRGLRAPARAARNGERGRRGRRDPRR